MISFSGFSIVRVGSESATGTLEFKLDYAGDWYVGVSAAGNTVYDPGDPSNDDQYEVSIVGPYTFIVNRGAAPIDIADSPMPWASRPK